MQAHASESKLAVEIRLRNHADGVDDLKFCAAFQGAIERRTSIVWIPVRGVILEIAYKIGVGVSIRLFHTTKRTYVASDAYCHATERRAFVLNQCHVKRIAT